MKGKFFIFFRFSIISDQWICFTIDSIFRRFTIQLKRWDVCCHFFDGSVLIIVVVSTFPFYLIMFDWVWYRQCTILLVITGSTLNPSKFGDKLFIANWNISDLQPVSVEAEYQVNTTFMFIRVSRDLEFWGKTFGTNSHSIVLI